MDNNEKSKAMTEAAKQLSTMIQNRLNSRVDALNALQASPMDSVPDGVKEMREIEAAKVRAVMQEQKDLLEIIRMLFPNA